MITEDLDFSPSYVLALTPSPVSKLSPFLGLSVCCWSSILMGDGTYDGKKAGSSINHSKFSGLV
jgi:hypothetical protein